MTGGPARLGSLLLAVGVVAGLVLPPGPAVAADAGRGERAWWYEALEIAQAHERSTGQGATVALIDTPIDPTVPELRGQDVVAVTTACGGPAEATGPLADHGTRMAAFIVGTGRGTGPDRVGIAGIAPGAGVRSYAVDAAPDPGDQCPGLGGAVAGEAALIDAAVGDGADIILVPGGTLRPSPVVRAAVDRALDAEVIVVAATGNATLGVTSVGYPAAFPGVVAAAAVNRGFDSWQGNVAGNREAFVISAPGVDIPSSGFDGREWTNTLTTTGTSDSAVFVAGGLAVVMAAYPQATGNQIIQHLIRNTAGKDDLDRDLTYGYGIMSMTRMLTADPTQWPDVNPLRTGTAGWQPQQAGAAPAAAGDDAAGDDAGDHDADGVPVLVWTASALAALLAVALGVLVAATRSRRVRVR